MAVHFGSKTTKYIRWNQFYWAPKAPSADFYDEFGAFWNTEATEQAAPEVVSPAPARTLGNHAPGGQEDGFFKQTPSNKNIRKTILFWILLDFC